MGLPWVRLDSTFPHNAKVLQLIDLGLWRAVSVYTFGLSYCGHQATGGVIPAYALRVIHARPVDAAALVKAGLWVAYDNGWTVHDWDEYQLSSSTIDSYRKAACTRWMGQGKPCSCGMHA